MDGIKIGAYVKLVDGLPRRSLRGCTRVKQILIHLIPSIMMLMKLVYPENIYLYVKPPDRALFHTT